MYDIPAAHVTIDAVLSNTSPTAPYRGAGRPEASYLIERAMEAAARELAIDPIELRRRNIIPDAKMPYKTALGPFYDCGQFSRNMDPAMKKTLSDAPQGKGAVCEWNGNNAVGQGRMEIPESLPASKILIKLDFLKPFEAHNFAEFIFERNGNSTNVTWAMFGPAPYIAKVISLFMNCDKMVGPQFETGLANMKAVTEM